METNEDLIKKYDIKPQVLTAEQIMELAPFLAKHPKLTRRLMKWLRMDGVNWLHEHNYKTPGAPFVRGALNDLDIKLRIDNVEVLDRFKEGAFITVSNHPFGALDGISLIDIVGSRRPEFKVIVNMVLDHISAMRPNFINVDQSASTDPRKRAVSTRGIKEAIMQVRRGQPLGMFPAGAMSNMNYRKGYLIDREWQPAMIRLIMQLNVPVIPIYFHGTNSFLFNLFGKLMWQLRTLRLPSEVFRKAHSTIHVSIGDPITPEEQKEHQQSVEEFGQWLKDKTYELRKWK